MAGSALGFRLDDIDPEFRTEIIDGAIGEMQSVFLSVFPPKQQRQMSGSVPYIPSKYTLRSADETPNSKIAINESPDRMDSELASAAYRFDGKYAKTGSVHKTTVQSSSDFDSPEAILSHILRLPMIQIAGDIDSDAKSLLTTAGSTNDSVAAVNVWSDSTNARPVQDLDALMDNGMGAYDVLWLGESEYRELAALPALVSFANNYSAVDARAPKQLVANWLFSRYTDLSDVIIDGSHYNTVNPAQSISTGRLFDGVVWAGAREHMISLEFEGMREVFEDYDRSTQEYFAEVQMYYTFIRAELEMGCVLTGF